MANGNNPLWVGLPLKIPIILKFTFVFSAYCTYMLELILRLHTGCPEHNIKDAWSKRRKLQFFAIISRQNINNSLLRKQSWKYSNNLDCALSSSTSKYGDWLWGCEQKEGRKYEEWGGGEEKDWACVRHVWHRACGHPDQLGTLHDWSPDLKPLHREDLQGLQHFTITKFY